MKYIIGIDAGTTSTKCVLFDEQGREVKIASHDTAPVHSAEICAEQDMDATWTTVLTGLKEITQNINNGDIVGIGITGQGEGCWLVDKEGKALNPAIIWMDSRSSKEVDLLYKSDAAQKIQELTGNAPQPCNTMMNLLWMSKNDPKKLEKAKYLFFCKDWVKFKLTGQASLDPSDGSTSLLYGNSLTPAKEVFEILGLSQYMHLLPPVVPSEKIAGRITGQVAALTGLKEGTPVISGCIDVQACGLGIGAIKKQETYMILGTTCVVNVVIDKFSVKQNGSRTIAYGLPGLWTELLPTLSGTPNLDWGRDHIALHKDFAEIEANIVSIPAGSGGVIYHPYLAGERAPFYNPNARASFFGINFSTTRFHLIKAIYEGMTYSLADCIKDYKIPTIYLTGGGSHSNLWAQLIADIIGVDVVIKKGNEFGAKGAAILAGLGVGVYKNTDDIARITSSIERSFQPNMDNHNIYKKMMELYLSARGAYEVLWDKRTEISQ